MLKKLSFKSDNKSIYESSNYRMLFSYLSNIVDDGTDIIYVGTSSFSGWIWKNGVEMNIPANPLWNNGYWKKAILVDWEYIYYVWTDNKVYKTTKTGWIGSVFVNTTTNYLVDIIDWYLIYNGATQNSILKKSLTDNVITNFMNKNIRR